MRWIIIFYLWDIFITYLEQAPIPFLDHQPSLFPNP